MNELLQALRAARLIQFGHFQGTNGIEPVRFEFAMLASYPNLLLRIADAIILPPADRLLCPDDAFPLGMALSLKYGIPLVCSRAGSSHPDSPELIGAYDIGHPTVLVTNILTCHVPLKPLIAHACQVGLQVTAVVALLDAGYSGIDLPAASLFCLDDIIDEALKIGELPAGQAELVRRWCFQRKTTSLA